jgi:hypothetical protein
LPGDYYADGVVDALDYVVWRGTRGGQVVLPFSGADGNGDGMINQQDYDVWQANFGRRFPAVAASTGGTVLDAARGNAMMAATSSRHSPQTGHTPWLPVEPAAEPNRGDIPSRRVRPALRVQLEAQRDDAILAWYASYAPGALEKNRHWRSNSNQVPFSGLADDGQAHTASLDLALASWIV